MNIALLAFDLDGTTITQHQYLPQENRLALEDAAAQGILLVPASGRMKDFLPREIISLPGVRYAITANGAGVYDLATGEAVWQRLIPNEKARQVQAVLEEYDLFVEYYSQGKATTRQGDPERAFTHFGLPESKRHFLDKDYCLVPALGGHLQESGLQPEKINLPYLPTPALRQEVWQRLEALGGLVLTSSIPDNIEVNAQGADKGSALRALAERLTAGLTSPAERAKAIYDYVTGMVDYRYQPAYLQLDCIADQCAKTLRGDCGVFALLFITLCRIAGIPARWQSGLSVRPDGAGPHDWAMFYLAPHGWLWADCSFGSSARRSGEDARRAHYFGSLDPWRMVANSAFQAPLTPPMTGWRQDPYDNQVGELMVDGRGLDSTQRDWSQEVLELELL